MTRARPRLRALAVASAAVALALPGQAPAHALLVRSEPADGSRLEAGPREVQLRFGAGVAERFASVRLLRGDGREVAGSHLRRVSGTVLALELPRLRRGTYAVAWRVLAEDDGHMTGGTLVFGVGVRAIAAGQGGPPGPAPLDVALRWLRFAALAVLLGGLAFAAFVLPIPGRTAAARRAGRRVLGAAAVAAAFAVVVELASLGRETASVHAASGRGWVSTSAGLLGSSRWGAVWLGREACLLALLLLVLRRPRAWAWVAAAGAAALATVDALGSHAASEHAGTVAAAALHLLAASVWTGAVAALALASWRGGLARSDLAGMRLRFALLAGTAALAALASGLYLAGVEVASVDALLTTGYGKTLLAKGLAVAAVCSLGAANFALLRSGRAARGVVAAEAAVASCALLAAAMLAASAPARGPAFSSPSPVRPAAAAGFGGDLLFDLGVRPNRPGTNVFTIAAASTRRPPPAPLTALSIRVAGTTVALRQVDPGQWLGSGRLDAPGAARATVVAVRGAERLTAPFRWTVAPPDPARPVTYSSRRLAPILDRAAVLLLLGALLAAGALLLGGGARRLARLHTFPPAEERP